MSSICVSFESILASSLLNVEVPCERITAVTTCPYLLYFQTKHFHIHHFIWYSLDPLRPGRKGILLSPFVNERWNKISKIIWISGLYISWPFFFKKSVRSIEQRFLFGVQRYWTSHPQVGQGLVSPEPWPIALAASSLIHLPLCVAKHFHFLWVSWCENEGSTAQQCHLMHM